MNHRESSNKYLLKEFQLPSRIDRLSSSFLNDFGISLFLKRDDLIHPIVSGNKWRKLKYNVEKLQQNNNEGLLTCGGAFSNHLIACAKACQLLGISSVGIVRGESENKNNPTLSQCIELGMQLHFISRAEYKQKDQFDFIQNLFPRYKNYLHLPEGGANELGIKGCTEILDEQERIYDFVTIAAGTTTTAQGIGRSLRKEKLLVFPALKNAQYLENRMRMAEENSILKEQLNYFYGYHFGGFAKINDELIEFTRQFYNEYNIKLDLVYTAKMFYGLFEQIKAGYFSKNSTILAIHSGGLQGNQGFEDKHQFNLFNSSC